jgi:hypothetical protein
MQWQGQIKKKKKKHIEENKKLKSNLLVAPIIVESETP